MGELVPGPVDFLPQGHRVGVLVPEPVDILPARGTAWVNSSQVRSTSPSEGHSVGELVPGPADFTQRGAQRG